MGNSKYCYPLTIVDKKSRYILSCKGHYRPTYESVKREYLHVFKEYGLPQYIHTDNGSPFGSVRALKRYSKLSYWLIDHGVEPLFSDPASPQQNGKHERMHRDLKAYCKGQIKQTLAAQQRVMDGFVKEYNEIRPHEALGMETPGSVHQYSDRVYKGRPRAYDYPVGYKVLKVLTLGAVRWGGYHWVYIASGASGKYIGMEELGNGIWKVYYRHVFLGYMDQKLIEHRGQYLKLIKAIV